jgi:CubicO group peptidase (beta-lactamase class C family)
MPDTRPWRHTLVMPYSVTKPFAALCVLTLVDRGLVDLDAPMQRYWPDLRAAASVRDVLAHRAGIAAAFLTGHIGDYDRGDRLEGVVRDVLGLAPL